MCGIAGYIGTREIPSERLADGLSLMWRRGPDAGDIYTHRRGNRVVHLLHSRLSIIDLHHRADQPFERDGGVLVYNGELYNYPELREGLRRAGSPFHTTGDTEVAAASLGLHGTEALDQWEGMWAFALYEPVSGRLTLSRDRFGEKPLYVLDDGHGIYFASEPKFIAMLRGAPLEPDYEHLRRYLVNGYKALYKQPASFYAGLQEVQPGTSLIVSPDGTTHAERYWAPQFAPDDSLGFDDVVGLARDALLDAVKIRLRADVPLAFCMSGGVDSNTLIAIARNVFDYDVHGFTIVNTDERYEEQALVNIAVERLGLKHTSIPVDPKDFLDNLRVLVRQHDAPVYTITYYAHWRLMESIANHGYRIALSGTAADELFTGYFDHHLAYLAGVRGDAALHAESLRNWERHIKPVVRNPFLSDPDLFVRDPQFRDHIYLGADRFSSWLQTPFDEPFAETAFTDDVLRNRMLNELFHEAVPVILHEDDRNAMYYSIENRSPFLDRRLFETTMRFPTRHLIRNGYAKAVLRESMRGIVPDEIIDNHRKVGFNAPVLDFLDVEDPEVRAALLEDSPIWDLVRREPIEALIAKPTLPNSESKFLFSFVNAKVFLEECSG